MSHTAKHISAIRCGGNDYDDDDDDDEEEEEEEEEDANLTRHECGNVGGKEGLGAFSLH